MSFLLFLAAASIIALSPGPGIFYVAARTLADVIAGFEAAWAFFGGVFAVLVPDNLSAVVAKADPVAPRITDAFTEYAQSRGFVVDPGPGRSPQRQGSRGTDRELCAGIVLRRGGLRGSGRRAAPRRGLVPHHRWPAGP